MVADLSVCPLLNGALSTRAICFLTPYNSFNRQPLPLIHAGSPSHQSSTSENHSICKVAGKGPEEIAAHVREGTLRSRSLFP